MSISTRPRFVLGLTSLTVAFAMAPGCGGVSSKSGNSNTNWLQSCDADADCGKGLACLCGTCTRSCASDECNGLGAGAACVTPTPVASSRCGGALPPGGICSAACNENAECSALGSALRCIGGACLVGVSATTGDAGADSTTGNGGTAGQASGGASGSGGEAGGAGAPASGGASGSGGEAGGAGAPASGGASGSGGGGSGGSGALGLDASLGADGSETDADGGTVGDDAGTGSGGSPGAGSGGAPGLDAGSNADTGAGGSGASPCPATEPTPATPCANNPPVTCSYASGDYMCGPGGWNFCPRAEPLGGGVCSNVGLNCIYGTDSCGCGPDGWNCCPPSQPAEGSSCSQQGSSCHYAPGASSYDDACVCTASGWSCAPTTACPTTEPPAGTPCSDYTGTACSYGSRVCACGGTAGYVWECGAPGTWATSCAAADGGAGPFTLATLSTSFGAQATLLVDGSSLFVREPFSITRIDLPCGGATTLATGVGRGGMAADATNLYFTKGAGAREEIVSAPRSSGGTTVLWTETLRQPIGYLAPLALSQGTIYFAANAKISSLPVTGGTPTPVVAAGALFLTIASGHLVWVGSSQIYNGVFRYPLSGGTTTPLFPGDTAPGGLASDGVSAFFTYFNSGLFQVDSTGTVAPLENCGVECSGNVMADTTSIYYGVSTTRKLAIAGGAPSVLSSTEFRAQAIDATSVYWTRATGSTLEILTAPK